jgi:hypothetical protein
MILEMSEATRYSLEIKTEAGRLVEASEVAKSYIAARIMRLLVFFLVVVALAWS